MPGLEKLTRKVVACVTCDYWKGEVRRPSDNRQHVLFESFQRGVCAGRGPNSGYATTPLSKCKSWRLWAKMHKARVDQESVFGEYTDDAPDDYFQQEEEVPFIVERGVNENLRPSKFVQELLSEDQQEEAQQDQPEGVQQEGQSEGSQPEGQGQGVESDAVRGGEGDGSQHARHPEAGTTGQG